MAMRGRGGGRGNNANRQPRLIVNRVFEQFKPMSEWRQEDGYDTLLVYLPGFQKENIKVTTEDVNVVRVRGERLVSENKWSQFQEDYRVPENCEMGSIRARFDGGILTIIMPRKIINAPPPPTTTTNTARVASKKEQPQKPKEEPKEKKPDKPQTTRLEDKTLPPKPKPTSSSTPTEKPPSKPQTTRLEDKTLPPKPKPKPTSSSTPTEKPPSKPQTTGLEDKTWPPQPKPTSSSAPTKQQPSKHAPDAKKARDGIEHDAAEKPRVGEKTDLGKGKEKEALLKEETKTGSEGSKGKPKYTGGLRGIVVKPGTVNEDRKLLVNVGVGLLTIAALGVHVSYTIGLIGKEK